MGSLNLEWWLLAFLPLGALSVLFPLLSVILQFFQSIFQKRSIPEVFTPPIRLEVVIPAFHEEKTIHPTLQSVYRAALRLREQHSSAEIKIVVGLDGSRDGTERLARAFAAEVKDSPVSVEIRLRAENRGKWATLVELIRAANSNWLAIVDAGTLWPEDFLVRVSERLLSSRVIGIAPGYCPEGGGVLSRLIWWQERALKSFENMAGGPFSLHGATMIFRTREVKQVMEALSTRAWLNDDVVIGLSLRKLGRIEYLGDDLLVGDCGVRHEGSELGRRRRMLLGNLEWIRELWPRLVLQDPALAVLALRRVMRVFWAYLALFCVFALARGTGCATIQAVGVVGGFLAIGALSRRLREAGWVSLMTPLWLIRGPQSTQWG